MTRSGNTSFVLTSPSHKPSLLATSCKFADFRSILDPILKAFEMFLNPAVDEGMKE